ncbi:two tm domain protein [Entamoeba histolytica]|uniref:Two tm domain protein n=1 Tax=Entamoeba histolytica TaxID=5759 RepID=A0A175JQW2_ENTHI|nr:two tm domain protein [Entamoeba histolytica]
MQQQVYQNSIYVFSTTEVPLLYENQLHQTLSGDEIRYNQLILFLFLIGFCNPLIWLINYIISRGSNTEQSIKLGEISIGLFILTVLLTSLLCLSLLFFI